MKVAEVLSQRKADFGISFVWQNTHYVDRWHKQTDAEISAFISQWLIHKGTQTDITAEQISAVLSALRNRHSSKAAHTYGAHNEMQ